MRPGVRWGAETTWPRLLGSGGRSILSRPARCRSWNPPPDGRTGRQKGCRLGDPEARRATPARVCQCGGQSPPQLDLRSRGGLTASCQHLPGVRPGAHPPPSAPRLLPARGAGACGGAPRPTPRGVDLLVAPGWLRAACLSVGTQLAGGPVPACEAQAQGCESLSRGRAGWCPGLPGGQGGQEVVACSVSKVPGKLARRPGAPEVAVGCVGGALR